MYSSVSARAEAALEIKTVVIPTSDSKRQEAEDGAWCAC